MAIRPDLVQRIEAAWDRPGGWRHLLRLLSTFTYAAYRLRLWSYRTGIFRTIRLAKPVIVVGNVVAGGGGKTPTVIAVVRHLQQKGWQVGVISRGYGGQAKARPLLVTQASSPCDVGDEPLILARTCQVPVVISRDRVAAGQYLLAQFPQVDLLVSDDGLQHLALARDLEVVVFDDRGVGNGRMIPAGWLREPWPRPADMVLHTGNHPAFEGWRATRRIHPMLANARGQSMPLSALTGQPVAAIAGIARPQSFFDMLTAQGVTLSEVLPLPDHFDFDDWQPPKTWQSLDNLFVVCTEKDAIKIGKKYPHFWVAKLDFEPELGFFAALDQRVLTWHQRPAMNNGR